MSRFSQYLRAHGFKDPSWWDTRVSNDQARFRRDPEPRTSPGGHDTPSPDKGYNTPGETPER